ncbi:hypothetical protein [Pseudonocardia sp. T1-2H]|uniref:hypothetical protein n=1 Tax=Pseudonocardia sp. T1-2H TaxID=3128899 RepID=UPI0031016A58
MLAAPISPERLEEHFRAGRVLLDGEPVESLDVLAPLYLAEVLAMDVAELITMLASHEGRDPLERLDAWDHDELRRRSDR